MSKVFDYLAGVIKMTSLKFSWVLLSLFAVSGNRRPTDDVCYV